MPEPKRKAGSKWKCSHCTYELICQPGREQDGLPCGTPHCKGKLEYRGGVFVYPSDQAFDKIDNYYLIGYQPEKRRKEFHPKNRITKGRK